MRTRRRGISTYGMSGNLAHTLRRDHIALATGYGVLDVWQSCRIENPFPERSALNTRKALIELVGALATNCLLPRSLGGR